MSNYAKVNAKDIIVGVQYYDITGSEYWPLVCVVTKQLNQQKTEVDATSDCGQDFLPGNDDNSFEAEVYWVTQASYAGDPVLTAKELHDIFTAEGAVNIRLADSLTSPVNYGFEFEAKVFGFADDMPQGGGPISCSLTFRPSGAITNLI